MRRRSLIVLGSLCLLAACSTPPPSTAAPSAAPTQTNFPATDTAVPPASTETAVPQSKLPAAPFESQPYINEGAGFALDIPSSWTVNETVIGPRGTEVLFVSKPELA